MTKEKSMFDQFTGKYQLSKTLRFELKPMPRTKRLLGLDNEDIFPKDKERAENYAIIKIYIDKLHSKFINAALALQDAYIDIADFAKEQKSMEGGEEIIDEQFVENNGNEEKRAKSKHHQKIIDLFNQLSKAEKIGGVENRFKGWVNISKNKVSGKLFEKELIDVLKTEFKDEMDTEVPVPVLFFNKDEKGKTRKLKEVFNSFGKDKDGNGQDFTTYFSSAFHDNRRNYYKADGKAGRVATRVVDENLKRFITNLEKFNTIKAEHPELFNERWKEYFVEKGLENENWVKNFEETKWQEDIFGFKYRHFLQSDIDRYNYITRKLNKDINESGSGTKNFQKLHKQVHGEIKKQDEEFKVDKNNIFSSNSSFIKKFIEHSRAKLVFSQKIFSKFFNEEFSDPKNVFLSSRAITTISNKCFASWHTFGGGILDYLNSELPEKKRRKKLPDFVTLQIIKDVLDTAKDTPFQDLFKNKYFEKIDSKDEQRKYEREALEKLRQKLKEGEHWKNFLWIVQFEYKSLVKLHNDTAQKLLAETVYKKGNKDFSKEEQDKQVGILFDFAESANGILNMTKYFALRKRGVMVEDKKYKDRDNIHEQVESYLDGDNEGQERCLINGYYKALKDFVTKKPWIEDKVVLNFDKSQFLGGWAQSQETVKGGVILRKKQDGNDLYYLAALEDRDKTFFKNKDLYENVGESVWQKMVYIQLQEPHRMLPKNLIAPFFVKESKKYQDMNNEKKCEWFNELESKGVKFFLNNDGHNWTKILKEELVRRIKRGIKDKKSIIWAGIDRKKNGAKKLIKQDIKPSDKFLENYLKGKHTKENLDRGYLQEYFGYLKESIKKYYKRDNLSFPDTAEFSDTSPFYTWVKENVYNIKFVDINEQVITDLVINHGNRKQVYLFQIYNKDFELDEEIGKAEYGDKFLTKKEWRKQKERKEEEKEQGRENLETTFFKSLFDSRNLDSDKGVVYKLSGGAKMFYRPASEQLGKKKIKGRDGREKEVVDRQRYKEDKFFLHVPIVMNFVNKNKGYKINDDVNKLIAQTSSGQDKFRVIALDRGEKHLAYLAVLNENGKVLEMQSLNRIQRFDKKNNPIPEKNQYHDKDGKPIGEPQVEPFKDYHNLLDQREIERLKARKSWKPIEKIADLKEGYLGFVVNKIADLVIQAIEKGKVPIVVLENLNAGMKQGRIMIEKQVYSKVEEKIAKKLNYLVDKKLGNFFEAWQLTPEIKTFGGDIEGKSQVGIILYVNPGYTSATCPACGFRRRKYIKTDSAKTEFANIDISFDGAKYKFKDPPNFKDSDVRPIGAAVYSNVRRAIWDRYANNGRGGVQEVADVTKEFSKLFREFGINYRTGNINKQIQNLSFPDKEERKFWTRLCKWFHCVLEIRNSVSKKRAVKEDSANGEVEEWGENRDFIVCPHCYFDSEDGRKWSELEEKIYIGSHPQDLNFNGDANGAYNIGRKGIIAIAKIRGHRENFDRFIKAWNIQCLPKKDEEIPFTKGGKKFTLTTLKDDKKQPYYCFLKTKKESFESIPVERNMRKYPDLFISDNEWDEMTAKWAKENGRK